MGPYFGASALRMEVSESNFCLQLQFDYQASGPLVQNVSPAKSVLNVTTTFDLVFSSDRSSDRFTGKPVSQTTGLYYEYARWYDPSIGRFINEDPLAGYLSDPQSLNPYVYSGNTPTTLTDPSGMSDSGGFLGAFDTYVSRPYLSWFDQNIEVPLLTFENGGNQAAVEEAVNQNAGLEVTLFDVGVVASAVVLGGVGAYGALGLGEAGAGSTIVTTAASGCAVDEQACQAGADSVIKDLTDLGAGSATDALTKGATDDLVSTSTFWDSVESSNFWSPTRQGSRLLDPLETMTYHFGRHVPADFDISLGDYTRDALSLRNLLWDTGRAVPFRSFGGTAWKITTEWGPGGIYTLAGKIISFWYEMD